MQRCFNYFDINSNFDIVIEKNPLKTILSENGIVIDGFNDDLDEQAQNNNVWDLGYLSQLESENWDVKEDEQDHIEISDIIYFEDDFSKENQKFNEQPLYYKNCTFTVQEVACLLSGYTPLSVDGKWNSVRWLKENPKFEEALDFVWSAVHGNIFDEIYADYFVIESDKLKTFLAERGFLIDGFNQQLEPLEKDTMLESINLIVDSLKKENEKLKVQLLEKDEMIKELKTNQINYDLHPSLNPNNPNHAPELLIAIEVWDEKYQNNEYPHLEHTPSITNLLKKKGITQTNLVKRICAITNIKSNKSKN